MLKELGEYKNRLRAIFQNDSKICNLLLGENYEQSYPDISTELNKYLIQHPYVPNTITDNKSYVLFETYCKETNGNTKTINIVIQAISNIATLEYPEKPENYFGLRYDVLSQCIEELLCPINKEEKHNIIRQFGIGSIELKSVEIFSEDEFIGRTLTFSFPTFR